MNISTQITAVLLGLVGGALLLIALAFVPYWKSLHPVSFTDWFGANVHFIARVMAPLAFATALLTWIITGVAWWKKLPIRGWLTASSVCALIMVIVFPIYFRATNLAFAEGAMTTAEISGELLTWQCMHWVRTVAAIVGCFCAVRAAACYISLARTSGI